MYKPIKHLSQRQKRNLRQKIVKSLGNECSLSLPKRTELPGTLHNVPEAVDNSVLTEKTSPADGGQNDTIMMSNNLVTSNFDEESIFGVNNDSSASDTKSECCACPECEVSCSSSKIAELRRD